MPPPWECVAIKKYSKAMIAETPESNETADDLE
jgi:hypothetical protein